MNAHTTEVLLGVETWNQQIWCEQKRNDWKHIVIGSLTLETGQSPLQGLSGNNWDQP